MNEPHGLLVLQVFLQGAERWIGHQPSAGKCLSVQPRMAKRNHSMGTERLRNRNLCIAGTPGLGRDAVSPTANWGKLS